MSSGPTGSYPSLSPRTVAFATHQLVPRIEEEIPNILTPFEYDSRRIFQADEVSSADLYHVHQRYPDDLRIPSTNRGFARLLDAQTYHLQYHSYERQAQITENWYLELEALGDPRLEPILAPIRDANVFETAREITRMQRRPSRPDPLPDETIDDLASIWHAASHASPGTDRLRQRLRIIEHARMSEERFAAAHDLFGYRSIISGLDEKTVRSYLNDTEVIGVPGIENMVNIGRILNLTAYWQPLNIFFDRTERSGDLLAQPLSDARAAGLEYVLNPHCVYFSDVPRSHARHFDHILEGMEAVEHPLSLFSQKTISLAKKSARRGNHRTRRAYLRALVLSRLPALR